MHRIVNSFCRPNALRIWQVRSSGFSGLSQGQRPERLHDIWAMIWTLLSQQGSTFWSVAGSIGLCRCVCTSMWQGHARVRPGTFVPITLVTYVFGVQCLRGICWVYDIGSVVKVTMGWTWWITYWTERLIYEIRISCRITDEKWKCPVLCGLYVAVKSGSGNNCPL